MIKHVQGKPLESSDLGLMRSLILGEVKNSSLLPPVLSPPSPPPSPCPLPGLSDVTVTDDDAGRDLRDSSFGLWGLEP